MQWWGGTARLPAMCGGPAKCQDTRQSASASLPGRVTATRSGTSTTCPGCTAGSVSRVRPHQAYCRTGDSAPGAARATGALPAGPIGALTPLSLTSARGGRLSSAAPAAPVEGAQLGTPSGKGCPSAPFPISMHTAAGAASELRSTKMSGTTHREEPPAKSKCRPAGPRSCASMGGAVCSLLGQRQRGKVVGGMQGFAQLLGTAAT